MHSWELFSISKGLYKGLTTFGFHGLIHVFHKFRGHRVCNQMDAKVKGMSECCIDHPPIVDTTVPTK